MLDLNDAEEQRPDGIIPDGTFVKVIGNIRPGGSDGMEARDRGVLKLARPPSDALMIDWEFTVLFGPYAKRKVWKMMTVAGGKLDDKGVSKAWNISRRDIRAMIESAANINPKDMSDESKMKRLVEAWIDLDGIKFAAKIGIELGGPRPDGGMYPDKNTIIHIVVPGEAEYQAVMAGEEVPAKPNGRAAARVAPAAAATPAWQQPATQQGPATRPWGSAGDQVQAAPAPAPASTVAGPTRGPAWLNQ